MLGRGAGGASEVPHSEKRDEGRCSEDTPPEESHEDEREQLVIHRYGLNGVGSGMSDYTHTHKTRDAT